MKDEHVLNFAVDLLKMVVKGVEDAIGRGDITREEVEKNPDWAEAKKIIKSHGGRSQAK
jgi:hypothetical protein